MLYIPAWIKLGVQLKLPVPLPLSINVAPLGSDDVVKVGVVASGSVAETENARFIFSVVDCAPIAVSTGDWLPASLIVMETISLSPALLSSMAENITK